jgi:UDP-glucose 4-epimerase
VETERNHVTCKNTEDGRMKALVTGGAGFIGGHLSERLIAAGHHVICIDDLSSGDHGNIREVATHPRFEFVQGSILDARLMDSLAARSDTIFHLAAAVGVQLIMARSLDGLRTNLHGTEIVLDCAHRHGARALIASTSEVYGKSADGALREDQDRVVGSPLTRRWSYAEAKGLDETMAHLFWSDHGVPTVIVRLFNIAGPRQRGRYGMVIPRFVDRALRHQPLKVYGDGKQTRSFCHVRDALDGMQSLIDHPGAYGGVFNIGCPQEVSIRQLAERVIALTGSASTVRHVTYREAYGDGFEDTRRRVPDISRARELVGYQPRFSLDEIIRSVIQERRADLEWAAAPAVRPDAAGRRHAV